MALAMQGSLAQRAWPPVLRRWLDRLGKRLTLEVVIDPASVDDAFAHDGGSKQLDKVLAGSCGRCS